jgi:hypothetical protein
MTKPKDPQARRIPYPTKRAKPGTKAKARAVAVAAGQKTFYWFCPRHGMSVFSTAGTGTCRCCMAETQKAAKDHRNTAARVRSAEKRRAAQAAVDAMSQAAINAEQQRQDYSKAIAVK